MVGLGEWWDKEHHSGSEEITEKVKDCVLSHMKELYKDGRWNSLGVLRKKWGQEALDQHPSLGSQAYSGLLDSLVVEFQEGVIIWHIGTDVFLANSRQAKADAASAEVEAIKMMSNYMMFLLVKHPGMLPGLAQNRLYQRTCENLIKMQPTPSCQSIKLGEMLQSLCSPA